MGRQVNPSLRPAALQLGDSRFFLKGLCVVDDIAFFGIAPHTPRGDRADPSMNCHLAAYDLKSHVVLWARQLPTHGLLNVVAAPHLAVESTTYSLNTAAQINYKTKKGEACCRGKMWKGVAAPAAGHGSCCSYFSRPAVCCTGVTRGRHRQVTACVGRCLLVLLPACPTLILAGWLAAEFESLLAKAKETPLAPLAGYKAGGGDVGSRVVRSAGEVWSASKARRRQAREEYSGGGGGVALGAGAKAPGRHSSGAGGDGGGSNRKLSLSETEQLPLTDPVAKVTALGLAI